MAQTTRIGGGESTTGIINGFSTPSELEPDARILTCRPASTAAGDVINARHWPWLGLMLLLLLARTPEAARADSTFVYAVQISAGVQTNPPQITLNWRPDPLGALHYEVYRKSKNATRWGEPVARLDGAATNWADSTAELGSTYEYQIVKQASLGYTGYGYIYSGVEGPLSKTGGGWF